MSDGLLTDWGEPPWQVEFALPPTVPPAHAEVAVIGGGFTGLSAAWHLARRGLRPVVLEAATIGAGASGRTGGIVLEGTAAGPRDGVADCLPTLARVVAEAAIECSLALPGCWQIAHERGAAGPAWWRDGDAVLRVAGTEAGGTIHPGALIAGLARAAVAAGAVLCERACVERLDVGTPARLTVGGRTLIAERVVVALNAYTTRLLALGDDFTSALTLALATAPLEEETLAALGLAGRMPFYTLDLPYLWGRVAPDGRLVVGAGLVFPAAGRDVTAVGIRDPEAAAALARLEERVRGLHPALACARVTHRWGGPIAFRRGREPLLARLPHAPTIVVTGGYAGHGVALGVRIGALIADALVEGTPLPAWGALRGGAG